MALDFAAHGCNDPGCARAAPDSGRTMANGVCLPIWEEQVDRIGTTQTCICEKKRGPRLETGTWLRVQAHCDELAA